MIGNKIKRKKTNMFFFSIKSESILVLISSLFCRFLRYANTDTSQTSRKQSAKRCKDQVTDRPGLPLSILAWNPAQIFTTKLLTLDTIDTDSAQSTQHHRISLAALIQKQTPHILYIYPYILCSLYGVLAAAILPARSSVIGWRTYSKMGRWQFSPVLQRLM